VKAPGATTVIGSQWSNRRVVDPVRRVARHLRSF